ncbi:MAG: squalene/phytoene synthase family protein [Candidatus Aenigmarchaeota archaeon]|nr:squalene/phytoene synthase family protein [Candidatus Aenigmarchaeota archaeon]
MQTENDKTISDYIASSKSYNQTDDSLKDEDNAAWIMQLPEGDTKRWISVLHWVRLADRLLERDRLQAGNTAYTFSRFLADWKKARSGEPVEDSEHTTLFSELQELWKDEGLVESDLTTWDLYLTSLEKYTRPGIIIGDMEEYEKALYGLSGTFFQAFPFKPKEHHKEAGILGTLDQFYNNLRDLHEDSARGVYYFPEALLQKFGIDRSELPKLVKEPDSRFVDMNEFLLTSFVPKLKSEAAAILSSGNLHPSWKLMIRNNFRRYSRIEYVFRLANHNAAKFSTSYWDHVRADTSPEIREKFRTFKSTLRI